MKVKVIFLPYIFLVFYVLCFTRPRYQVSVSRTIGPLVENVIRVSLKVPSITIVLSMGSLNGKNRLSEVHLRFLSNFPFVNLQIKSIVESLRPIKLCTQSMKKISNLLKNMHFWVKNRFSEILTFLRIC